jgi:hypothetical protein
MIEWHNTIRLFAYLLEFNVSHILCVSQHNAYNTMNYFFDTSFHVAHHKMMYGMKVYGGQYDILSLNSMQDKCIQIVRSAT